MAHTILVKTLFQTPYGGWRKSCITEDPQDNDFFGYMVYKVVQYLLHPQHDQGFGV